MFGGNKFEILGLDANLSGKCNEVGWEIPTEIQRKSIPIILKGNDVIGLAETGSGKTGAFILPILQKLYEKPQRNFALILTPTHELAEQIEKELLRLSEEDGLKIITLLGGEHIDKQSKLLRSEMFHIVIGTLGRVVHHIRDSKLLNFKSLRFLVLDEADRMLSDDFLKDLEIIVPALPKERQTCLFSATMSNKLEKLETVILKNAVRIEVSRKRQTVDKLRQEFVFIDDTERILYLVWKLQNLTSSVDENASNPDEKESVIVFTETKKETSELFSVLKQFDLSVVMLQGDMKRDERQRSFDRFVSKKSLILVATDVASRGLDIPNVSLVINYSVPDRTTNYQHRVGRTARAGKSGLAISIVTPYTVANFLAIERDIGLKITKMSYPRVELDDLRDDVFGILTEVRKDLKEKELELGVKRKEQLKKASQKESLIKDRKRKLSEDS